MLTPIAKEIQRRHMEQRKWKDIRQYAAEKLRQHEGKKTRRTRKRKHSSRNEPVHPSHEESIDIVQATRLHFQEVESVRPSRNPSLASPPSMPVIDFSLVQVRPPDAKKNCTYVHQSLSDVIYEARGIPSSPCENPQQRCNKISSPPPRPEASSCEALDNRHGGKVPQETMRSPWQTEKKYVSARKPPTGISRKRALGNQGRIPKKKEFFCPYDGCGKAYVRKYNLQVHERSHLNKEGKVETSSPRNVRKLTKTWEAKGKLAAAGGVQKARSSKTCESFPAAATAQIRGLIGESREQGEVDPSDAERGPSQGDGEISPIFPEESLDLLPLMPEDFFDGSITQ